MYRIQYFTYIGSRVAILIKKMAGSIPAPGACGHGVFSTIYHTCHKSFSVNGDFENPNRALSLQ